MNSITFLKGYDFFFLRIHRLAENFFFLDEIFQTRKTTKTKLEKTAIRPAAVREACVCWHHQGGPIEGLYILDSPRTSQQYGIDEFKWSPYVLDKKNDAGK